MISKNFNTLEEHFMNTINRLDVVPNYILSCIQNFKFAFYN